MATSHALIAGINSGKSSYLIRKAITYALSGKSVLYVDPEHTYATINKKLFAYRDNDELITRNISILSVPVHNTSVLYNHLEKHTQYDIIIIDLPMLMVSNPTELSALITALTVKYDVLFSMQAKRTFYENCESGNASAYITNQLISVDSASVIIKTQEPSNSDMIIYTEYKYNTIEGTLDADPVSRYYIKATTNNQIKLMPFGDNNVNIFDADPSILMGILNVSEK